MFLSKIMEARRDSPRFQHAAARAAEWRDEARLLPPARDLLASLRSGHGRDGVALIAEIKRASPSRGLLSAGVDPSQQASIYAAAGASAVSVLTEERYFMGSLDDLRAAREACSLPVLRKDFLTEPWEIWESRAATADAVLLIAALLDASQLRIMLDTAAEAGMTALLEVHDESEMQTAVALGAPLIGINNRDLTTFDVDLAVTERLAPLAPEACLLVSESGVSSRQHIERVTHAGAHAVLVGESLMTQSDAASAIATLLCRKELNRP
jgi:indole-3-glycerol phosphate synthase